MEYVPEAGDVVWLSLSPTVGHEQSGRRPFLVLSPRRYNDKMSLLVGCAITMRQKGYPFEVPLRDLQRIGGQVLIDHVKSLDWRARNVEFAERATEASVRAVRDLLGDFLGIT